MLGAAEALELATLGSARALRLDDEIGSLTPGKQADLTVVSLAGTPFVPWEDPAAAVVLGGSPGRVVATLVAGETRYRKGGMQWHELTDAALSARGPAAPAARRQQHVQAIEDTMFFPRLRRHAKWVFVLLALVFGLGFVLFGVGAGGTASASSCAAAAAAAAARRRSPRPASASRRTRTTPQAQRDLATALQLDGKTEESIAALQRYTELAPGQQRPPRARRPVPLQGERGAAPCAAGQIQAASTTGALFAQPAPGLRRISRSAAIRSRRPCTDQANQIVNDALTQAQQSTTAALDAYRRLAAASPNDPPIQLELAQTAQNAGDTQTAIAAYEKFLKLAPDDPVAAARRAQLQQLRQPAAQPTG